MKDPEFMEFLDSQSLVQSVDINKGIKYSHNSLVFQEKKRTLSVRDLQSGLGRRRMSKQELARIKEFTEKKRESRIRNSKVKTEFFKES